MIKKILYVGSRDKELVDLVQTLLKERSDIVITPLDRADLNFMDDRSKQKVIDWNQKDSISQYIRKPENISAATEKAESMYGMIKEMKVIERYTELLQAANKEIEDLPAVQVDAMKTEANESWDGWFSLKDMVEATTISYKSARDLVELLFAFGFIAEREANGQKLYTMLLNNEMIVQYLDLLIKENQENIDQFANAKQNVLARMEADKQSQALAEQAVEEVVVEEAPAPKKKAAPRKKKIVPQSDDETPVI